MYHVRLRTRKPSGRGYAQGRVCARCSLPDLWRSSWSAPDVAQLTDQALEEIRTMSYLLHPPLLDEVGFACAAEWFIE